MQPTYKVRNPDGAEFGPAGLEQLLAWIREGRVGAHQEIQRSDMQHWAKAGDFTELKAAFAQTIPPALPAVGAATGTDVALLAQMRSCSSWFYWVAALSLVNSVVAFAGGGWRFLFGLGITQVFDGFGTGLGGSGKFVALFLDLIAAGVLVLFGVLAGKRHTWAFIVGMVLLLLDGGILLLAQDWIGVAFHAFVLFRLFQGLQVCRQLNGG